MTLDAEPLVDPVVDALVVLFRTFMGLENDQVVVYNEDWDIPPDRRLYVSIALLATKPFGSSNRMSNLPAVPGSAGVLPVPARLVEAVTVQQQETYTLNIFSASDEAMFRNWELSAALNSTMGQQAQEQAGFALSSIPLSVTDLSGIEGARRLYRYALTITLLRSNTRENVVEYYDQFTAPQLTIEP